MSKRTVFVEVINKILEDVEIEKYCDENSKNEFLEYWEVFQDKDEKEKPLFTDNGKLILKFLQDNQESSMWRAKSIAEGLGIGPRTISGSMRKLVTDGYVEKIGKDPSVYSLTEKGLEVRFEEE